MKVWQNKACKGKIKLNVVIVYINNVGYISEKRTFAPHFAK